VSASPLQGRATIDVTGLVVTAGFIDLHSHGQTAENYACKARDGVTTALELEVGANPVAAWYAERDGRALVNYGASSGHIPALMAVRQDTGGLLPRDAAVARGTTPDERVQTLERVRQGLNDGGLGVGMGIAYTPKVTREEVLDLFELAAERRVPVTCNAQQRARRARRGRLSAGIARRCASHRGVAARRPHYEHGTA
jgi:Amidohydrolase family